MAVLSLLGCVGSFGQSVRGVLETKSGLTRRIATVRSQKGGCFRAEFPLLYFEFLDLGNEALAKAGMRGQTLIILSDLFAQILALDFEQSFRILFFQTANE